MNCEICGRAGNLRKVLVEGVEMECCEKCSGYGRVLAERNPVQKIEKSFRRGIAESEEEVIPNIGGLVLEKRRELGLKQDELAGRLGIKASLLSKIEGGFVPSVPAAKKIGHVLGIRLVKSG